ncbi:MAG: carboxylesterase family protein [Litorimonas sp.]
MRRLLGLAAFALTACAVTPEPVTQSYLGIEYATAQRWELPEVNEEWNDAEPFDTMGPPCPQDGQSVMIEDCLFLNVFSPSTAKRAPVLIWFHGGGFRAGLGGDGPKTFVDDGIVVVTFNYRLGKLGFHDWPGWDENDPRNFGQADMVAALDWVQKNIGEFGGDPKNVTLAGHSAGGMGVQLMLTDPRASGKYAQAWAHAGYGAWPFPKAYNPSPEERARIRFGALETERSAAEIVAQTPFFHLPYIDAPYLREQPSALWQAGRIMDVPIVTGWNSYDGAGTLGGAGFSVQDFIKRIDSPDIRAAYASDFAISDTQAAQRIFGDMRYGFSSLELARQSDGQIFYYDARRDGAPGAYHGQQYEGVFNGIPSDYRNALLQFIETGNPGWDAGEIGVLSPELTLETHVLSDAKRSALAQALEAIQ